MIGSPRTRGPILGRGGSRHPVGRHYHGRRLFCASEIRGFWGMMSLESNEDPCTIDPGDSEGVQSQTPAPKTIRNQRPKIPGLLAFLDRDPDCSGPAAYEPHGGNPALRRRVVIASATPSQRGDRFVRSTLHAAARSGLLRPTPAHRRESTRTRCNRLARRT